MAMPISAEPLHGLLHKTVSLSGSSHLQQHVMEKEFSGLQHAMEKALFGLLHRRVKRIDSWYLCLGQNCPHHNCHHLGRSSFLLRVHESHGSLGAWQSGLHSSDHSADGAAHRRSAHCLRTASKHHHQNAPGGRLNRDCRAMAVGNHY
jgi:hypothetical protein